MFKFIRFKLTLKIFLSFLLIIGITVLLHLLLGFYLINSTMEQEVEERLKKNITVFKKQIGMKETALLTLARKISSDSDIAEALKYNRINELKKMLVKLYRLGIADIIEIEDADGRVVARGHHPELEGDIKLSQEIVKKGLAGESSIRYEKGMSGMAIRAVSPIVINNDIHGLVMVGTFFSKELVHHFYLLTGLPSGIYKDRTKMVSTYTGYDTIGSKELSQLKTNHTVFLHGIDLDKQPYYLMLKPVFLQDTYWGALSMGLSKEEAGKVLVYSWKILFLFLGIGLALSLVIYLYLGRYIHNSLKQIITPINTIQLEKFDSYIKLESNDEFGIIAESINNLIKKIKLYNMRLTQLQEDVLRTAKINTAGQLAAGIAHEIRNPLSSVRMMVQIIKKRYLAGRQCEEINIILDEIERINKLVKELLEFSKPTALHLTMQDINACIIRALEIFNYNIEHQNIDVKRSLDKTLPEIYVDNEKMTLVFINLIINAIQAMPGGGILSVCTEREGGRVVISVENSVGDVDVIDSDKIFEPFYTTKKEGTGLGLALARAIVERHNGELRLIKGAGTLCFSVAIPMYEKRGSDE